MVKQRLFIAGAIICALWGGALIYTHYPHQALLEMWVLDVGQGESVLVREPTGKKLLFDGGPSDQVLSELGGILAPWDRTIDIVVLSHIHSDHVQGLIGVVDRYHIKELWISGTSYNSADYKTFLSGVNQHHIPTKITSAEYTGCTTICPLPYAFGKATLQVYHPVTSMQGAVLTYPHDATIVVKVSYTTSSILLTGDLDEGHEQDIISACHPPSCSLRATVLQIPHHGSKTGLSAFFLSTVHPEIAVIPVGLNNKFGHPGAVILKRLQEAHVPIYRTDTEGQIHIVFHQGNATTSVRKPP